MLQSTRQFPDRSPWLRFDASIHSLRFKEIHQTYDGSDGEDFEANINAVSDTEALMDDEDSSSNELGTLRIILTVPQSEASMHEIHKATLQKDHLALSATVPACSHNCALAKTSALNTKITAKGKKYMLFYYFWPDDDPHNPIHWASPEVKLNGAMAELYKYVSKDLHKSMEKYTAFDSLTDARKPDTMVADEFLKSPELVKIICIDIYGKKVLSGKTKDQKARGQHCNAQCVTKGLIAGAAVIAHFLLTYNPEFTATGVETKINHQADYNFYLECLFKKILMSPAKSLVLVSNDFPSTTQARTWEDDLLNKLNAPTQTTSTLASLPATSAAVNILSSCWTLISVNQGQTMSVTAQLQLSVR
ncbi:hypothetical protein BDR06DRAFT_969144 [Suillus hirtellus]|nr:hypothetical protein BDR06DRAFT_969144 [Suillus hirtellus]